MYKRPLATQKKFSDFRKKGSGMSLFLFIGAPGGAEWIIILLVALLLFGKRLPDVARSMGKSITEFKKGLKGVSDQIEEDPPRQSKKEEKREE